MYYYNNTLTNRSPLNFILSILVHLAYFQTAMKWQLQVFLLARTSYILAQLQRKVAKMSYLAPHCLAVSKVVRNNSRTVERIFIKCYIIEFYLDLSTHSSCYNYQTNITDTLDESLLAFLTLFWRKSLNIYGSKNDSQTSCREIGSTTFILNTFFS